jgi:hypothetical protein
LIKLRRLKGEGAGGRLDRGLKEARGRLEGEFRNNFLQGYLRKLRRLKGEGGLREA